MGDRKPAVEKRKHHDDGELPEWVSHKHVHAAKIAEVQLIQPDGAMLAFEEPTGVRQFVDGAYLRKHQPSAGGYYVKYADGYESWSPAEAFEEGYTRV